MVMKLSLGKSILCQVARNLNLVHFATDSHPGFMVLPLYSSQSGGQKISQLDSGFYLSTASGREWSHAKIFKWTEFEQRDSCPSHRVTFPYAKRSWM